MKDKDSRLLNESYKLICERLETEKALDSLLAAASQGMSLEKLTDYVDIVKGSVDHDQFKTISKHIKRIAGGERDRAGDNSPGILRLFQALIPTGILRSEPEKTADGTTDDGYEDEGDVTVGGVDTWDRVSTIDEYLKRYHKPSPGDFGDALKNLERVRSIAETNGLSENDPGPPPPEDAPAANLWKGPSHVRFNRTLNGYDLSLSATWYSGNQDPSIFMSLRNPSGWTNDGKDIGDGLPLPVSWDNLRPNLVDIKLKEILQYTAQQPSD